MREDTPKPVKKDVWLIRVAARETVRSAAGCQRLGRGNKTPFTSIRKADDVDEDASSVYRIRSVQEPVQLSLARKSHPKIDDALQREQTEGLRQTCSSTIRRCESRAVQVRNTIMPLSNQEVFCDLSKWAYQQLSSGSRE
jgi:hypothetical protein